MGFWLTPLDGFIHTQLVTDKLISVQCARWAGYLTGPKLKVMNSRMTMTHTARLLLAESLP